MASLWRQQYRHSAVNRPRHQHQHPGMLLALLPLLPVVVLVAVLLAVDPLAALTLARSLEE